MNALVLDTAGPVIGLAAFESGVCIWHVEERIVQGADAWLLPAVRDGLSRIGGAAALRGGPGAGGIVVVGVGPGAFTGVRVGLATALGLAESVGCRVLPVSSLAMRAAACPGLERLVVALDARKGRVYVAGFDTRGAAPRQIEPERDVPPEEAFDGIGAVTGEGALVYREQLGRLELVGAPHRPGAHAAACFLDGEPLDPARVQLAYLRGEDQVVTVPRPPPSTAHGRGAPPTRR